MARSGEAWVAFQEPWRKQLSKREGFGKQHHVARERCEALIDRLRADEELRAGLRAVQELPEPRYTDAQWHQLEALRTFGRN